MSPEEFFMYLTIGLIVVIPLSVRLYRYLTAARTQEMLQREFERPVESGERQGAGRPTAK